MGYRGEDVSRTPADWGHQQSSPGTGQGNAGSWIDEAAGYGNGDYDDYASDGSGYGYQPGDGYAGHPQQEQGQYSQRDPYGAQPPYGEPGGYDQPGGYGQPEQTTATSSLPGRRPGTASARGGKPYGQPDQFGQPEPGYGPPGGGQAYQAPNDGYGQPDGYGPRHGGTGGYPAAPDGGEGYQGRDAGNDWYGGQPAAASGASFADTGTYALNGRIDEEYGTGPNETLHHPAHGYPPAPGRRPAARARPAGHLRPAGRPAHRSAGAVRRLRRLPRLRRRAQPDRGLPGRGPQPHRRLPHHRRQLHRRLPGRGPQPHRRVPHHRRQLHRRLPGCGPQPHRRLPHHRRQLHRRLPRRGPQPHRRLPHHRRQLHRRLPRCGPQPHRRLPHHRGQLHRGLPGRGPQPHRRVPHHRAQPPGATRRRRGDYDAYAPDAYGQDFEYGGSGQRGRGPGADYANAAVGYDDYAATDDPYQDPYGEGAGGRGAGKGGGKKNRTAKKGGGRPPRQGSPGGRRPRTLALALGTAVVVVVAAAAAYFLVLKPNSPTPNPNAGGRLPSAGASPSNQACVQQYGTYCHIEARTFDPAALTLAELYPPVVNNVNGHGDVTSSFTLETTKLDTTCSSAVIGQTLISALKAGACTQVLRASYLSGDGKIMGTIGVINLVSTNEAHYAGKVVGQNDFIAPLAASKGIASKLGQGTGVVEAQYKGHYLILTWSEFVNGIDPVDDGRGQRAGAVQQRAGGGHRQHQPQRADGERRHVGRQRQRRVIRRTRRVAAARAASWS